MRSDIVPGATFPDYELPDHETTPRKLSEIQGDDPRNSRSRAATTAPREHQQHLELAANYPKIAVAYTEVATIATDPHHTLQEFRSSVGAQWTFLASSAALPAPTFRTEWTFSAGTIRASPALYVFGPTPAISHSNVPSST